MLEEAVGQLIAGAVWGIGAGVVLTLARGGGEGLRGLTKGALKGYVALSERVQETTAEWRENAGDLAAEVRAERADAEGSGRGEPG